MIHTKIELIRRKTVELNTPNEIKRNALTNRMHQKNVNK